MKHVPAITAILLLSLALLSCGSDQARASKKDLKTFEEKSSYALGMDFGENLKRSDVEVDVASILQGLEDVLRDRDLLLSADDSRQILTDLRGRMQEQATAKREVQGAQNLQDGEAFLLKNRGEEGVATTESGLQYLVITQGDGPKPKATDRVTVHYRGTLIDGTEFDSSHRRGQPATFALDAVIPGWTEGLQLMPVGSTYRLFIPPDLAYGERGAGGVIGPNATLIFEVELLSIEP